MSLLRYKRVQTKTITVNLKKYLMSVHIPELLTATIKTLMFLIIANYTLSITKYH